MFNIEINTKPIELFNELVLPSKIIINEFYEWFYIPISYWNIEQYKFNWKGSLEYGLKYKKPCALITSMHNPVFLNFISTWILYFYNDLTYIQNKVFFVDDYDSFDIYNINNLITQREIYNEDGIKISEWQCKLEDISKFYSSLV